jgi:plastocyanin
MNANVPQRGRFSRQPLSTPGKISFWAYVVATLAGIGGIIALTITSGAPSRDIVTITILTVITAILVVSGIRWLQALAVLTGIYLIYISIAEPFAFESLANPKVIQYGGMGHFVGNVVLTGLALVAFAANIAEVVRNFRRESNRQIPHWLTPVLSGVIGAVIGAILIGAIAQPPATASTTLTNGVPTVHMSAGNFDTPTVTIIKGSKLLLVDDTSSLHILANGTWQGSTVSHEREPGAPLVNNVQVKGNSVEIGPFPVAGTYHIFCEVHQGMNLTIIVQ